MNVNSKLNKDCLLAILKWLPFQEQFVCLRLVCKLWKKLVEKMFRSKKSLTLISSGEFFFKLNSDIFFYLTVQDRARLALKSNGKDDHLQIQLLGKNDPLHFIEIIGQMFPQVETLVFSFDTMSVRIYYTALPQLITRWPNLESLTLAGAIRTTPDFSWLPLLKALNSLKSLKRFEMFIDCVDEYLETVDFSPMDMQCYSTEASFIQQLEYFLSISSLLNIVDNVLPLFSPNCKRLHPWDITSISSLTTVTPTLTHLALGDLIIKDDELIPLIEIISSRFTKLQFLDLCLNGEVRMLAFHLSKPHVNCIPLFYRKFRVRSYDICGN